MRVLRILFSILVLACSSVAFAQFPVVTSPTATPIPGAGHDYLKGPAESVNPATGSVSIRIPVIIPPGRGVTLPFSFAYDSSGANYLSSRCDTSVPSWLSITVVGCNSGTTFSVGGWSESVPIVTHTVITWQTSNLLIFKKPSSQNSFHLISWKPSNTPSRNALPAAGTTLTCHAVVGFVYQDAEGNRHNLGLSTYNDPNGQNNCTLNNQDWPFGFTGQVVTQGSLSTGADAPILSSMTGAWDNPTLTITNPDGSSFTTTSNGGMYGGSFLDRYGNSGTVSGTYPGPGYNYLDTTGRKVLQDSGFATNPETVTIIGLGAPYTVNWTTSLSPTFSTPVTVEPVSPYISNCPNPIPHQGGGLAVSSITLPNGQSFTFAYDPTYGVLSKMTYPTGGYVRYVWGINPQAEQSETFTKSGGRGYECDMLYGTPAVTDRYVSYDGVHDVLHQTFGYSTTWPSNPNGWTSKQTIVTTYDLVRGTSFETTYNYSSVLDLQQPNMEGGLQPPIPVESSVQYYNDLGTTLLKTVSKTWQNKRLLTTQNTAYPNGKTAGTTWSYNSNEMETEHDDKDFGSGAPGSPLRKTVTNYQTFGANYIVDRPSSVIVYDGNMTSFAETDYTYDSPAGTATSGIVQHSGGCNCGSLTLSSQWVGGSSAHLNTTYTNDDTGQRLSMTDPRGYTTHYSYSDSYSGSSQPPGSTNAYLTLITNALNQTQKFSYNYPSGEVTSSTDPNTQVTSYQYNDPGNLARLTETDLPDGGVTTIAYTDTARSVSVETKRKIDISRWTDNIVLYNGLGLPMASSSANDEATPWDRTDTCYDGNSGVLFSSYPYQVSSGYTLPNCSGSGDTTTYDALGRATQVSHSDGSTVSTIYTGAATQVQDEGNGTHHVTRVSQVDGLGRLSSACEVTNAVQQPNVSPPGCSQDITSTGFLTSYLYDPLGNLLSVTQGTLNSRTFKYDMVSRLFSAANPESGTITYVYDTDPANACPTPPTPYAGLLVKKLDFRGVRTCYQYETLSRVSQKNYSDGTPTAFFNYDQSSALGVALLNTVGRLSSQTTAQTGTAPNATGEIFSYDQLGRVKINSQCTPQNCSANTVFPVQYTYDLLGDMLTSLDGVGITLTYGVNKATRLTSLTSSLNDSTHPGTLFSAAHYNPAGSLLATSLGCVNCSINETRTYDSRLRLASISDGSNYAVTIPSYAPNSDILTANDSVNGNWTYTYDDFNRITGSNQNNGQSVYSYNYDQYGNRWHQAGPTPMALSFTGNNNRMDGYTYDAAGNLLCDLVHSYSYDAESRISQVDGNNQGTCSLPTNANYVYSASGERVRKTTGSTSVDYLYDLASHEIIELSSIGAMNRGEVYAGNRHIATYELGTTYLNFSDWLGTERLRALATGVSCESITSLPFGDGQNTSGSCGDSSPLHFTGKQRDSESGLDNFEARYYSSNIGRFISADWSAIPEPVPYTDFVDPQSLNLYTYVRNVPTVRIDISGHEDTPGPWALLRSWLDVVEISGSYGLGLSAGGQAGKVEVKGQVGSETEGTIGLGGGNGKVETFAGGKGTAKAGSAEAEIKVGVTVSTKDGVTVSAKAQASLGPKTTSVTVDKAGVHTDVGAEKNKDTKVGAHATLGLGIGLAINTSQAGRAYDQTAQSTRAAGSWLGRQLDKLKDVLAGGVGTPVPPQ